MGRSRVRGDTGLLLDTADQVSSAHGCGAIPGQLKLGWRRTAGAGGLGAATSDCSRRTRGVLKAVSLAGLRSRRPRAQIGTELHC
jgi:hypothetical protein